MECDIVVDGGGSTTRLGLVVGGGLIVRRECGTCNAVSAGVASGAELLARMIDDLWEARPREIRRVRTAVLALSNVSTPQALGSLSGELSRDVPRHIPLQASQVWIVNDIVPLVVGAGVDAVAIAGTGTGFAALSADGVWARASGLEYLLADEGGGFDIGLQGLRAVVRSRDGRGSATQLNEMVTSWGAGSLDDLAALVYGHPSHKVLIASFAPSVLAAAESGDVVASSIVNGAARELLAGLQAVCRRTGLAGSVRCGYSGSLLLGDRAALRLSFEALIEREDPGLRLSALPSDTLGAVAELAKRLSAHPELLRNVPLAGRLDQPFLDC